MKLRNELILIAILAAVAGCSTAPKNEVLRSIPEYGDLPTCDVSARLYVRGAQNVSRIVSGLSKDLRDCGYPVCSDADFSAAHPVIPDFVIEVLYARGFSECFKGETVVFAQIVVRVRRPTKLDAGGKTASFDEKPRDFQAVSRRIIGKRKATVDDYRTAYDEAVGNMMRNPAFRSALVRRARRAEDGRYGFDMETAKETSRK